MFDNDWDLILSDELSDIKFSKLQAKLDTEYINNIVYPSRELLFRAMQLVPYHKLKVVIVGQDPYHGGQADGLAFSVEASCKLPPSLKNIFNELVNEYGVCPKTGDLINWANQGVLLLNATLTVIKGMPNSHSYLDWTWFTDSVISHISNRADNVVFLLMGNGAIKKSNLIDKKHTIICTPHPSPLSAYRGFLGSNVFKKINLRLIEYGYQPIDWVDNNKKDLH